MSSLISVLLSLYSSFTGFRPLEFAYPIAKLSRPSRSLELAMTNPSDSPWKEGFEPEQTPDDHSSKSPVKSPQESLGVLHEEFGCSDSESASNESQTVCESIEDDQMNSESDEGG